MQILVVTDIHANLIALEAVLQVAGKVDAVWCLGDVVGYGPFPNECIERLQQIPKLICLLGNHDAAALKQLDITSFNPEARLSIEWLQQRLTPESVAFLESLPERQVVDQVTLTHGSPREPVFEYLLDTRAATENFDFFDTNFCFVGHTHIPVLFHLNSQNHMAGLSIPAPDQTVTLTPRAIINPGSVGQPRDRDPRASYAIFDPEANTWHPHRVEYDVAAIQKRMTEHGLPERHIHRLEKGW